MVPLTNRRWTPVAVMEAFQRQITVLLCAFLGLEHNQKWLPAINVREEA